MTPHRYTEQLIDAARRAEVAQREQFERLQRELRAALHEVSKLAGQVRERQAQDWWAWGTLATGAVVGAILGVAVIGPLLRALGH